MSNESTDEATERRSYFDVVADVARQRERELEAEVVRLRADNERLNGCVDRALAEVEGHIELVVDVSAERDGLAAVLADHQERHGEMRRRLAALHAWREQAVADGSPMVLAADVLAILDLDSAAAASVGVRDEEQR